MSTDVTMQPVMKDNIKFVHTDSCRGNSQIEELAAGFKIKLVIQVQDFKMMCFNHSGAVYIQLPFDMTS